MVADREQSPRMIGSVADSASQCPDRLLAGIAQMALEAVPAAARCVIHLLDPSGSALQARYCSSPSSGGASQVGIPVGAGIAGRALQELRLICVDDAAEDPRFLPLQSEADIRSLLVAPLCLSDVPLGTLSLSSPRSHAFGPVDCQSTRWVAAQASMSLWMASMPLEAGLQRALDDDLADCAPDGLLFLDGQGRVAGISPGLRRILELDSGEAGSGLLPGALYLLDDPCGAVQGSYRAELDLASGRRVILLLRPLPLNPPQMARAFLVRDITRARPLARTRMLPVSLVSHELRTSLQDMLGFLALLNDGCSTREECQRYLGHIEDEIEGMSRLVDDLVGLSQIEMERFSVRAEPVRMDLLVRDVVSRHTPRAERGTLCLRIGRANEPLWALADRLRTEQVLKNLIHNAIKYAPAGSAIEVSARRDQRQVIVSVADQGPGISAEDLPHLFDPFYRGRPGAHKPGMGLGLYISRQIAKALGGDVWVESQEGAGSTFSFSLPAHEQA